MPYCTKADILVYTSDGELAQLTSEEGEIIDDVVIEKAIIDADATIDAYLSTRYKVPFDPVPPKVSQLSTALSLYNLFSRRKGRLGGINESVRTEYEDAIRFLEKAAKGDVGIGVDPPPKGITTMGAKSSADERMFRREKMKGM